MGGLNCTNNSTKNIFVGFLMKRCIFCSYCWQKNAYYLLFCSKLASQAINIVIIVGPVVAVECYWQATESVRESVTNNA